MIYKDFFFFTLFQNLQKKQEEDYKEQVAKHELSNQNYQVLQKEKQQQEGSLKDMIKQLEDELKKREFEAEELNAKYEERTKPSSN